MARVLPALRQHLLGSPARGGDGRRDQGRGGRQSALFRHCQGPGGVDG